MDKQTITRKDGITYERKAKAPTKLTRCLCIRISDDTFERLKKYDKPSTLIKQIIDEYLERVEK